jgi:hypothetical protein
MKCGGVYIKYNNGKFFLNSELAFWDQMTGPNATSISKVPLMTGPLYIDSWRFATELGVFSGPTKLSILYAFMPGQDRRYGKPVNKQPFVQQPLPAAYGLFRPYTYLLGYAYGSGVNAFDYDRNGYLNQAWILATRLDYAVAANLNLYGTFLWAERSSFGYGFGFIRPSQTPAVSRAVDGTGAPVDQVKYTPSVSYSDNPGAFSIPDLSLGWEAMLGMDWMLLENYRFSFLGSFWQPGRWFNYACIDRGVNSWDVPTKNNRWGVNPERVIDPVIGGEVRLTVLF